MVGGVGEARAVGEAESGMVAEAQPAVERHRGVTYEAFEPLEMKTQVVAGTNYFVKVRAAGAGDRAPRPPRGDACGSQSAAGSCDCGSSCACF
jgi:hypothetical protein